MHTAGVPKDRRGYRTRHQLALEMLEKDSASLPHGWTVYALLLPFRYILTTMEHGRF